ncbi:MAG: HAMP domain-containing histidine kinase [Oscillospiraceae bacterium]|nr:HAMP domain-containing histidine kinase [Oscillospiraceae bacterium]
MAIISKNKKAPWRYGRTQIRYAVTYIFITFTVLAFLNIYCSSTCKRLFRDNKEAAMLDKTGLAAEELRKLEALTPADVSATLERISSLRSVHIVVTDVDGTVIFASHDSTLPGQTLTWPQITQALNGIDAFDWDYDSGIMHSQAASPIIDGWRLRGCVYASETDSGQGALVASIQRTILTVTILLELVVILFSGLFTHFFSARLDKIMASMRILRDGNYTHRLELSGHDELTVLADEFNDLTERLNISENKRRQFVSDASHELKTPLASIKLLSDSILQNDMDIDTIREFVADIGDEAERLNRMSEKLLSLTKGEPDSAIEPPSIIPMTPTVERVVRMLSHLAKSGDVDIHTDLQQDCPILIREDDLYQITYNLAENGIKYNVPGGKLTIALGRGEDCGILTVSDTGTGIPEDSLSHIFERFYRVDKARSRASGGSGLGLAIVKNMVERNQGTIQVTSTFGMGTTFTMEFPAFDIEEEDE